MRKEYRIKGLEKILDKVSKEELAKEYDTDVNADFEQILTEYFEEIGIPNNSEIVLYVALTPEEYNKRREEGKTINHQEIASEFYQNDERKRAMYGINYTLIFPEFDKNYDKLIQGTYGNIIYFGVDESIEESTLKNMLTPPSHFVGGVHYNGLMMGTKFFEEHRSELEQALPNNHKMEAVESYIKNFVNEFENVAYTGGYGPREKYEETDEIKAEKAKNERIILELTRKSTIDELSLKDFINLKRRLEQEESELKKAFEEKFSQKENN